MSLSEIFYSRLWPLCTQLHSVQAHWLSASSGGAQLNFLIRRANSFGSSSERCDILKAFVCSHRSQAKTKWMWSCLDCGMVSTTD